LRTPILTHISTGEIGDRSLEKNEKTIWAASPTAFLPDGSLDGESMQRLVEQHIRLGVDGLFLGGTCGEGPYMPNGQLVELTGMVKGLVGGRLPLAVQVSDTSPARVRENMRRMEDAGADVLVLTAPWLLSFCSEGFARRYFRESFAAASLPIGVYITKQPASSVFTIEFWQEIIAHPKVRLAKDSSGDKNFHAPLAQVRNERDDLCLMTGFEFAVPAAVADGYDGCLLGSGVLNAGIIRHALDALVAGDRAAADAWQKRSNELLWGIFRRDIGRWLGGLKHALKYLGLITDEFMHLHYPLTDADRNEIEAAVESEREQIFPAQNN